MLRVNLSQFIAFVVVGFCFYFPCNQGFADIFVGPTPYLSDADIPLDFYLGGSPLALEDFEDGTLDFGITASIGNVVTPSNATDSVDGDDGVIDGFGRGGHSWFSGLGPGGISFSFSGPLPTAAGLVWTDGSGTTAFEAFDENGDSIGTIGPVTISDGSFSGQTAEDHFFGVLHASGISRIFISNSAGGIEVDHVQFGIAQVPEPSGLLVGISVVAIGFFRRRR